MWDAMNDGMKGIYTMVAEINEEGQIENPFTMFEITMMNTVADPAVCVRHAAQFLWAATKNAEREMFEEMDKDNFIAVVAKVNDLLNLKFPERKTHFF